MFHLEEYRVLIVDKVFPHKQVSRVFLNFYNFLPDAAVYEFCRLPVPITVENDKTAAD